MSDALVSIAGSNLLYQVVGGTQELLSSGPFEIGSTSEGGEDAQNAIIVAKVSRSLLAWLLLGTPSLLGKRNAPLPQAGPPLLSPPLISLSLLNMQVSDRLFTLEKNMPCLMTDDHTYTFAINKTSGPATFYCLILSRDNATEADIELLQTILASSTAFSGTSQVNDEARDAAEEERQGAQSSWSSFSSSPSLLKVSDGLRKGGSVLGSQLMKAASFAKEKAAVVLTEERKQQIKENASSVAATVAAGARKVAEVSKNASVKVYERVKESELAAKIGAGTRSALGMVYSEMQKASNVVVQIVKDAASKATRAASGEPSAAAPSNHQ